MLRSYTTTRTVRTDLLLYVPYFSRIRNASTLSAIKRGLGRSTGASKTVATPSRSKPVERQSRNGAQRPDFDSNSGRRQINRPQAPHDRYPTQGKSKNAYVGKRGLTGKQQILSSDQTQPRASFGNKSPTRNRSDVGWASKKHEFANGQRTRASSRTSPKTSSNRQDAPYSGQQLRISTPGVQEADGRQHGSLDWNMSQRNNADLRDIQISSGKSPSRDQSTPFQKASRKIIRTTAASEFIYGRSSVLAALKAGRRQMYKLYLTGSSGTDLKSSEELYKYALNNDTKVYSLEGPEAISEMDKITKGRPHNGVILEASPLPRLPVSALGIASKGRSFEVNLKHQSREEEEVNGSDSVVPIASSFSRYPLVVMLDEIVDQGNLGGILRSAYFLGADAVVLSSHMAILNAVALKAASGAAEGIRLLSVHNTTGFLQASQENGWKLYAAVAPPSDRSAHRSKHIDLENLGQPLQEAPCILLLGGEGEGLRRDLIVKADKTLSISGHHSHRNDVDSLNVSVAAGILMDAFLKKPASKESERQGPQPSERSNDPNVMF